MSKSHLQNKPHSTNRVGTSISVGPEVPNQFQETIETPESNLEAGVAPSYEDIQRKAYHIHQEKGGGDLENWLEAEQSLKAEHK